MVGYEVKKFLDLLYKNNPNILELIFMPEDCILYKHPVFDELILNRMSFLTKVCAQSFGGYAKDQINKAKGQDKKQNWEKDRVVRKQPIDFCYIHINNESILLSNFLKENNMDQKFGGLSKIPHSRDTYAFYYDYFSSWKHTKESDKVTHKVYFGENIKRVGKTLLPKIFFGINKVLGFKGISFESSNDIRLSSIPLECPKNYFIGLISYNKDGYAQHCIDYKSYQTWLSKRNEQRWVDVKSHDQKIDGKNMMHCRRLVDMAVEIAEGKGVIVRRGNSKELLDIRHGKVDLQSLIDHVEAQIKNMNLLYEKSNLPDSLDFDLINDFLIKIRKNIYNI